jgi:hypothetical protein
VIVVARERIVADPDERFAVLCAHHGWPSCGAHAKRFVASDG